MHRQRKFTKIKPGLTWLIVRGSEGVPGETSWYGGRPWEGEWRDMSAVVDLGKILVSRLGSKVRGLCVRGVEESGIS